MDGDSSAPQSANDRLSARELTLLVYRQMRALVGPRHELDDLAQTALEQILKANFEGRSKLSTFTYSVCYHVWLKHLRFSSRFRARFIQSADDSSLEGIDTVTPSTRLLDAERLKRLYAALARVSPKRRAVVVLHDVSGLEVREIADVVNTSEATVRSRLRDGRRKLAQLLAADPYFATHVARTEEEE